MSTTNAQKSTSNKIFNISLLGIFRAVAGLPIEHPFQTLKTWMQSQNQSPRQAVKHIYQKKRVKGFYAGFWINCFRSVSKAAYRWPLSVFLIHQFREKFKRKGWGIGMAGAAAGMVTAVVQSVIICPLQRIKVWLMTSYSNTNYSTFWKISTLKSLFYGFVPVISRQLLSWVSFLGTQEYLKELIYRYHGKTPQQYRLNNRQLFLVSILVCITNTFFVMPMDYIKTHFQKYTLKAETKVGLGEFIRENYRRIGLRGFYRGGLVIIIHYNIQAMLTVPMMQKMIRMMEQ